MKTRLMFTRPTYSLNVETKLTRVSRILIRNRQNRKRNVNNFLFIKRSCCFALLDDNVIRQTCRAYIGKKAHLYGAFHRFDAKITTKTVKRRDGEDIK